MDGEKEHQLNYSSFELVWYTQIGDYDNHTISTHVQYFPYEIHKKYTLDSCNNKKKTNHTLCAHHSYRISYKNYKREENNEKCACSTIIIFLSFFSKPRYFFPLFLYLLFAGNKSRLRYL